MADTEHWRVSALAKKNFRMLEMRSWQNWGASMRDWLLLRRDLALVFVRRLQSSHLGG